MLVRTIYCLVSEVGVGKNMSIISIEEIRTSNQLKKEKCNEAKAAMRDILLEDQLEKFDGVFDNIVGKVLKGVMMKEKE